MINDTTNYDGLAQQFVEVWDQYANLYSTIFEREEREPECDVMLTAIEQSLGDMKSLRNQYNLAVEV